MNHVHLVNVLELTISCTLREDRESDVIGKEQMRREERTMSWTFCTHHSLDLDRFSSHSAKEKIIESISEKPILVAVVEYAQSINGKARRLILLDLIDRNIWIGWQYSDYDVREHNQQAIVDISANKAPISDYISRHRTCRALLFTLNKVLVSIDACVDWTAWILSNLSLLSSIGS